MQAQNRPRIIVAQSQSNDLAPIVRKWMGVARKNWFYILVSIAVALALGYLYQARQSRVYRTQAVLLIDQTENGGSQMRTKVGNSQMNTLMQLNGISTGDNMKNEMFILQSLRLMKIVVPILELDVDYKTKSGLHEVALYKSRPFKVNFEAEAKVPQAMKATLMSDGRVSLTGFVSTDAKHPLSEADQEKVVTASLGQTVATPIGRLTIVADTCWKTFPKGKEVTVEHYPRDLAAESYHSKLTADEYDKEASLVVLTCMDINSDRAADILNTLVEVYKQDVINNKNSQAQRTAEFIDGRLELISRELSEVEGEFAAFKSSNKISDLTSTARIMTEQSVEASRRVTELNTELSVARYLSEYLNSSVTNKEVIPVVSEFTGSGLSSQIQEYNRKLLERNHLASVSSEQHPTVVEADRQLEAMRGAIKASLSSVVKSKEMELRQAQTTENSLMAKAGEVPVKEQKVMDIARQQNLKEALYTYLLNKREEVALQLAIEEANVRLVEDPASSLGPVSPRKNIIMLIALLLGLVLPFIIIYIRELFDTTVTTRKDVEDALSMPIVGELPHMAHSNDKTLVYGPGTDLSAPIAEAFRLLRYGLHYLKPEAKTILVTSSTPSHGKSFVSRNLASCIAMTQKRVLLIDADIRVRNLSRNLGLSSARGVTEYLIKDVDTTSDIIVRDGVMEGVDFLPAGTTPPNITELLMSERFDELINELREDYDTIILDTTPAFAVADASIVSRTCDLTLFVVRIGEQLKAGLPMIEELYKSKKCGSLCAVINDSDRKARSYGYGTGGYSYSYQYGYGSKQKKSRWKFWKK